MEGNFPVPKYWKIVVFLWAMAPTALLFLLVEHPNLISPSSGGCDLGCGIVLFYLLISIVAGMGGILGLFPYPLSVRAAALIVGLGLLALLHSTPWGEGESVMLSVAFAAGFLGGVLLKLLVEHFFPRFFGILFHVVLRVPLLICSVGVISLLAYFLILYVPSHFKIESAMQICANSYSQKCFHDVANRFGEDFSEESCLSLELSANPGIAGLQRSACLTAIAAQKGDAGLCKTFEEKYEKGISDFKQGGCEREVSKFLD
jgi:hypothetical protein